MKSMLLVILVGLIFLGCARTPVVANFAGKNYVVGDNNCVRYRQLTNTRIMCIDDNGREVGYRDAMSDQEIQAYTNRTINRAKPNNVSGKFYMAGDDNCVGYKQLTSTRIRCIDRNRQELGYRDAMSDQEISMYQHNRMIEQQESAESSRSYDAMLNRQNATNQQMNYNFQQQLNRDNVYKVKPVTPNWYGF